MNVGREFCLVFPAKTCRFPNYTKIILMLIFTDYTFNDSRFLLSGSDSLHQRVLEYSLVSWPTSQAQSGCQQIVFETSLSFLSHTLTVNAKKARVSAHSYLLCTCV